MTEEKRKELFPYFAYLYSKQMNPEKYGSVETFEDWSALIKDSPEDLDAIATAATELTDEDWSNLEKQYMKTVSNEPMDEDSAAIMAKKGAKLKKLRSMKKGKKMGAKKCSCGCDMVASKGKGGKMVYKCACGCGAKK